MSREDCGKWIFPSSATYHGRNRLDEEYNPLPIPNYATHILDLDGSRNGFFILSSEAVLSDLFFGGVDRLTWNLEFLTPVEALL
jgi:hypothetical protein